VLAAKLSQQALTSTIAIYICGVKEIDTKLNGPVKGRERFSIVNSTPRSTNRPGAETQSRYFPTCTT
jgi:hypothetical protein